uniref:Uncharacterized protein n=1 Tax=Arundo donax TaxID=35708 RepID=A0A0A8YH06_ARUDO
MHGNANQQFILVVVLASSDRQLTHRNSKYRLQSHVFHPSPALE